MTRSTAAHALVVLLAAAPVLVPAAEVAGQEMALESTADLLAACSREENDLQHDETPSFCYGFITGTGGLYLELVEAGVIDAWACAEPVPTMEQIRSAFVTWARAHPERLDDSATDGFWRAMSAAYPCE